MFRSALAQSTRLAASSSSSTLARAAARPTAALASSRLSTVGVVQKRSYHEKVLDHYNKPRNVRWLAPDLLDGKRAQGLTFSWPRCPFCYFLLRACSTPGREL